MANLHEARGQDVAGPPKAGCLRQLVEQRLRLNEVARVEALGKGGVDGREEVTCLGGAAVGAEEERVARPSAELVGLRPLAAGQDRKSTRLNSSHGKNSYAVFCLKKKETS